MISVPGSSRDLVPPGPQQPVHGEADAEQHRHHDPGEEPDGLAAQRPLRLIGLGAQQRQADALHGEAIRLVKVTLAVHLRPPQQLESADYQVNSAARTYCGGSHTHGCPAPEPPPETSGP
ncbi:hypothetical protein GCM10020001_075850 [Nonomuraea salmonea]